MISSEDVQLRTLIKFIKKSYFCFSNGIPGPLSLIRTNTWSVVS